VTNLRDYARDKPCLVRSPACNGDSSTVVLAHVRQVGISGMGLESPDLLGAWCCSRCHSFVDQETSANREGRELLLLLRGVMRTQAALIKDEVVSW
jgi:hypothetical protein